MNDHYLLAATVANRNPNMTTPSKSNIVRYCSTIVFSAAAATETSCATAAAETPQFCGVIGIVFGIGIVIFVNVSFHAVLAIMEDIRKELCLLLFPELAVAVTATAIAVVDDVWMPQEQPIC